MKYVEDEINEQKELQKININHKIKLYLPVIFYPNEMPHSFPEDNWDIYENDKFMEQNNEISKYWSRLISLYNRIEKKTYCCKSDRKIKKWIMSFIN